MVKRGPGYFDTFVSVPNPTISTHLQSTAVDSRDLDPDLLKSYGYGITRPMPKRFKVIRTNKPSKMVIL